MWWCLAAAAQTTVEIDRDELAQMVAELYPKVAEHVGRAPVGELRSGILTRERLRAAIARKPPLIGERPLGDEPRGIWFEDHDRSMTEHGIAVYVPALRGLYLVKESVEELVTEGAIDDDELVPAVRCLVAHELVHALQHQYGVQPDDLDPDLLQGVVALLEGQATLEGLELCSAWEGEELARQVGFIQGLEADGTVRAEGIAAPYAFGRYLVRRLRSEDPELVWTALAGPAPRWRDVVADIPPILGRGWEDPAILSDGLAAMRISGVTPKAVGPRYLGAMFGGTDGLPAASAGWVADHGSTMVAAFRVDEGEAAVDLVMRRAAQAGEPTGILIPQWVEGGMVKVRHGRIKALDARADVRMSQWVDLTTNGRRYLERWVATDHAVAVVASQTAITGEQAEDALAVLLDRLPKGAPPPDPPLTALGPWLDGVRARRSATLATPSPQWRHDVAAAAWEEGTAAPCAAAFEDAFGLPEPWLRAAHRCAVASGEWDVADRAASASPALDATYAAVHAQQHAEAQRFEEGLRLLAKAAPEDAVDRMAIADAKIFVLGTGRRWNELAGVAGLADGSAEMRAQAADVLWAMGRAREGRAILAEICPGAEPVPTACSTRSWR